ncbi:MAG TPA: GntR family transcriptional regulator [Bacteroidetes bacterium]|nr:GntR family transcriptional regulator [Bacteroidota bacterium]
MIEIGKYNELEILRQTSVGLYLGDEAGEDILLPTKYCPEKFEIGDKLRVFVYRDSEDRKIATNLEPKIHMHEFALLECKDVTQLGAFLDWGLEKDLMVPFAEQKVNMEKGRWYVVFLDLDEKTDRLYGSAKLDQFLDNKVLDVEEGEEVDLTVYHHSELGYSAIVNEKYSGLIFDNEVFQRLRVGQKLKGFVKKVRPDNKLDISLQPIGYEKATEVNTDKIMRLLAENSGFLPFTDKSTPDEVYATFGISKKAFKKAVGALYKERKIVLEEEGIRLIA